MIAEACPPLAQVPSLLAYLGGHRGADPDLALGLVPTAPVLSLDGPRRQSRYVRPLRASRVGRRGSGPGDPHTVDQFCGLTQAVT